MEGISKGSARHCLEWFLFAALDNSSTFEGHKEKCDKWTYRGNLHIDVRAKNKVQSWGKLNSLTVKQIKKKKHQVNYHPPIITLNGFKPSTHYQFMK